MFLGVYEESQSNHNHNLNFFMFELYKDLKNVFNNTKLIA